MSEYTSLLQAEGDHACQTNSISAYIQPAVVFFFLSVLLLHQIRALGQRSGSVLETIGRGSSKARLFFPQELSNGDAR